MSMNLSLSSSTLDDKTPDKAAQVQQNIINSTTAINANNISRSIIIYLLKTRNTIQVKNSLFRRTPLRFNWPNEFYSITLYTQTYHPSEYSIKSSKVANFSIFLQETVTTYLQSEFDTRSKVLTFKVFILCWQTTKILRILCYTNGMQNITQKKQ